MKLWDCLDDVERAWLSRFQKKNYGAELNPPDSEPPPAPTIPVHITEAELKELKQGSHYRPGGADAGLS
jgi:hypothetical protein